MDGYRAQSSEQTRFRTEHLHATEYLYASRSVATITRPRPAIRLIVSGRYYTERWPGSPKQTHSPFTVLFQPSGIQYAESCAPKSHHILLEPSLELVRATGLNMAAIPFVVYDPHALKLITALWREIRRSKTSPYRIQTMSQELVMLVAAERERSQSRPENVEQMLRAIQSRFRQSSLRFERVMKQYGLAVCPTTDSFSRSEGCTMSDYRIRLRVEYARFMLLNSTMSMEEISYKGGFADPQHFSRQFTGQVGTSARRYRQRVVNGGGLVISKKEVPQPTRRIRPPRIKSRAKTPIPPSLTASARESGKLNGRSSLQNPVMP
jgi:AraC-like DNA-binding protein